MKIKICLLLVACAINTYGMEQENFWSITVGTTKINLNKGNMVNSEDNMLNAYADGKKKVAYIVVGKYAQQRAYYPSNYWDSVNDCSVAESIFFMPEKNNHSYKKNFLDRLYYFPQGKDYPICLKVTEPCYIRNYYLYYDKEDQNMEKMLQNLEVCYQTVLNKISQEKNENLEKSIALPTLGTGHMCYNELPADKATPVVVKAILEFVKHNPSAYDCIEFFVNTTSGSYEFDLYKELLEKSATEK